MGPGQSLLITSIHVPQVKIQGRLVLTGYKKKTRNSFHWKSTLYSPTNPHTPMTLRGNQNPSHSLGRGARVHILRYDSKICTPGYA